MIKIRQLLTKSFGAVLLSVLIGTLPLSFAENTNICGGGAEFSLSDQQKDLLWPVVNAGHLFCVNLESPQEVRDCMNTLTIFVNDFCEVQEDNSSMVLPVMAMVPGISSPLITITPRFFQLDRYLVNDLCNTQEDHSSLILPVMFMVPGVPTPFLDQFFVNDFCNTQESHNSLMVPVVSEKAIGYEMLEEHNMTPEDYKTITCMGKPIGSVRSGCPKSAWEI